MGLINKQSSLTKSLADWSIRHRILVLVVIVAVTVVLGYFALQLRVTTMFEDLLPRHPYMETHNQFKRRFGGENLVQVLIKTKAKEGDVFQPGVLRKIREITRGLRKVDAVNPYTIFSLTSSKLRRIQASTQKIISKPFIQDEIPTDPNELADLRESVLANPMVYGVYVSRDLNSALVEVDFYSNLLRPVSVFRQINNLMEEVEDETVRIEAIGNPMLYGWVNHYFVETMTIFSGTVILILLLLYLIIGTLRGTTIPAISGAISAVWSLGFAGMLGLYFDPLVIVIAFLIVTRVISHSLQLMILFENEYEETGDPTKAARQALGYKFKPGILSILTDAGAVLIVALMPIPLLKTIALIGFIWLVLLPVNTIMLTGVCLSWIPEHASSRDSSYANQTIGHLLRYCERAITKQPVLLLVVAGLVVVGMGYFATSVTIGDARPGSPILWPSSLYNRTVEQINAGFLGSNRMFVAVDSDERDIMKDPAVLEELQNFQRFAESQPSITGTLALPDLLRTVNKAIHENDPKYLEIGKTRRFNGNLIFQYLSGASPEILSRFKSELSKKGSIQFFLPNHQGDTIRSAVAALKRYIEQHSLKGADFRLLGGKIGVLAATNEVIYENETKSVALALLLVVILCTIVYRNFIAGLYFMVPIILSHVITFGYMSLRDIGLNINSLPVAALGIGLGIDYVIYVVDGIKEKYERSGDINTALRRALDIDGRAVVITVLVLLVSLIPWYFFSSLRFQAEMALLIGLWMATSSISALLVVPALVYLIRPRFVVGNKTAEKDRKTPKKID